MLFLASCKDNTEKKLNDYSSVTDYFTKEEIKDLEKLLDFFNEQICASSGIDKKDIIKCYDNYNEGMMIMASEGYFDMKISFDKQQEIYNQISDGLFHHIWGFSIHQAINSPDTIISRSNSLFDTERPIIEK
jgi:hypothetical protein